MRSHAATSACLARLPEELRTILQLLLVRFLVRVAGAVFLLGRLFVLFFRKFFVVVQFLPMGAKAFALLFPRRSLRPKRARNEQEATL